jgi:hypothetical protein
VAAEYNKGTDKPVVEAIMRLQRVADAQLRDQLLAGMFQHMDDRETRQSIVSYQIPPAEKECILEIFDRVEASKKAEEEKRDAEADAADQEMAPESNAPE